ncbi:MAG: hypothetical protein Q8P08_00770 [bacterium]|nr:hypothetical protein [bacterium]
MKTKKIVAVLLIVIVVVALVGCGIPQEVQNELNQLKGEKTGWEEDQAELQGLKNQEAAWEEDRAELNDLRGQEEVWEKSQAELNDLRGQEEAWREAQAELNDLRSQIEELSGLNPEKKWEVVGTVTSDELRQMARKFFPIAAINTSFFSGRETQHPLVGIETLKMFLASDQTNRIPQHVDNKYNASDELAFRLKDHWIDAGWPGYSINLIKTERTVSFKNWSGEVLGWWPIFITKENGELTFYEVNPRTDSFKKIENPDRTVYSVLLSDRM